MIDKEYGRYSVYCDICNSHVLGLKSFDDAVDYIKELDWKIVKTNGGWEHHCPDCKELD